MTGSDWLTLGQVGLFAVSMLVLFAALLETQCKFLLDRMSWPVWLRTPAFWAVVAGDLFVIVLIGWTVFPD
tara:strand:+ start:826 stop:1038 length:213 start_codon:yes stop_codon:yes gene_type:complete